MNQETYPERNLHTYLYLIYDKRDKNINGEKIVSSISGAGKTGQFHVKNKIRTISNTTHKYKLQMD